MQFTTAQTEELAKEIALRGLTLEERLRVAGSFTKRDKIDKRIDGKRLEVWQSWFNRDDADAHGWKDFLCENALTEEQLIWLENSASLELPRWTKTLRALCAYLRPAKVQPNGMLGITENLAEAVAGFAFEQVLSSRNFPLLSTQSCLALQQSLVRRLVGTATQVVNWEMLVAGGGRERNGAKDGLEFQEYFFAAGVTAEALRLLENYPALARLWTMQTEFWLGFMKDFLQHAADFSESAGMNAKPGPIISLIDVDLSDPHEGNRAVMRVQFGTGEEWFYKPRPGRQERAWFDLLDWFNKRGFRPAFQILEVRCEKQHYWMECAKARACRTAEEAQAHCLRLGALMYLVHLLRGVDFHVGNLVFARAQPVVIDCETLFHPATFLPEYARAEENSILRTGMLSMLKHVPIEIGRSRSQVLRDVLAGLSRMRDFVRHDACVLRHLQQWSGRVSRFPARKIYRPTSHYQAMLEQSLAPSRLTSGLERTLFLYACCRDGVNPPRRVRSEVRALQNADVPIFRGKPRRINLDLSEKTFEQSISIIRRALESHQGVQVHR